MMKIAWNDVMKLWKIVYQVIGRESMYTWWYL